MLLALTFMLCTLCYQDSPTATPPLIHVSSGTSAFAAAMIKAIDNFILKLGYNYKLMKFGILTLYKYACFIFTLSSFDKAYSVKYF